MLPKSGLAAGVLLLFALTGLARQLADTAKTLDEIRLRAYFRDQPILLAPSSAAVVSAATLAKFSNTSLLPAINTVPGVRMEERSPGSYRLSIRGSLLRSPFGVRNVKVYADDFMLTDAGGNTYLNLLDAATLSRLEIVKGPEGSIFGANTGGVVLISSRRDSVGTFAGGASGGSYGLVHEDVSATFGRDSAAFSVSQAFQHADGYRRNSAMNRQSYTLSYRWRYSAQGELKTMALYSDLDYRTPGGLTLAQAQADPRAARPAAGEIAGAEAQHAGIYNQTVLFGASNTLALNGRRKWVAAVSLMRTGFKNPFITNYEQRRENSAGIRTYVEQAFGLTHTTGKAAIGLESQVTSSTIDNYDNDAGVRGAMQSSDTLRANQSFGFAFVHLDFSRRLIVEAATSVDFYGYHYQRSFPTPTPLKKRSFDPQLMPRLAISVPLLASLTARFSAARGYSPPTIAEVRPSDNQLYTGLRAEGGWNLETGLRYVDRRLYLDAALFDFRLRDAIVRRLNAAGAEYFVNAGGTIQTGLESEGRAWIVEPTQHGALRSVQLSVSFTWSGFRFSDYSNGTADLSGRRLTGVPLRTWSVAASVVLPASFDFFAQRYYSSAIPLNDENSAYADPYQLVQLQAGWTARWKTSAYKLRISLGVDNVFNAFYSLGNDLNAVGNRFFNPAPGRNFYVGVRLAR